MKEFKDYFSKSEIVLWSSSVMVIIISFCVFDRINYMTLCASLIGVTSLIFNAKGNPFGQLLMVVFSLLYGIISYTFSYYGEMITYLGMTMPMAIFALISWLKNPYNGNKAEVKVNSIGKRENVCMWIVTFVVTFLFYLILKCFNTANIIPSTISVTTSFLAVYLTFRNFYPRPPGGGRQQKRTKFSSVFAQKGEEFASLRRGKRKICRWRFKKDKFWVLIWCEGSGKSVCASASHCG